MKPFAFVGKLPASKSMLNRLQLVQSYFSDFKIHGESAADDVALMRAAVSGLHSGQIIQAGAAGTVLRFMALRASRLPGRFEFTGTARLFARPQEELTRILRQLGVHAQLSESSLVVESAGWKLHGDTLLVPSVRSSQFATAVLFNAWDLPFDLYVSLGGRPISEGYWRMSVQMAQSLGMKIDFWDGDFRIPRGQKPTCQEFTAEIDMSSAFALAGAAAAGGQVTLTDFPERSVQPDAAFVSILERMGVPIQRSGHGLRIEKAKRLNGVAVNLKSTPDLFPVLAALCALAEGNSELLGASQLVHKESDRIQKMVELIHAIGRPVEACSEGIKITGSRMAPTATVRFDCAEDHRLAFAAAIFKVAGVDIEILNPESVSKSFPEFWRLIGCPI